ncbi:MAG: 3-keto-5-aminohexanoate cleavage protein [Desulfarculaceae bacterium]|nr:3-keto-5-aminohexanoate cleavage protein [Desulfarculaceae bacterium]MCF8072887.1 3-keto-5-aminohexanoate cleavage protein [Desulfarculaceae bacterium]MCF8101055.1 3-keto-5-aminohexanoate cleavage protein [Desulfarculaceae bacterium]MCF8115558.1 3-keto-5-aminohexanoate cleavage protein [Desulfarculaceae bacterium]
MAQGIPSDKVIITVAQTGAITNKSLNPAVPEQPEEIAASAYECFNEGAAIVHVHARDAGGVNTSEVDIFKDIHGRIREKCDLIIQDSTGGGPNLSQEERIMCLKAGPEMASLNMGSLMRVSGPYKGVAWSNLPDEIDWYVEQMTLKGIKPEMEVYSHAMLGEVRRLIAEDRVQPPYYVNIVLGMRYQGAEPATPQNLASMVRQLPEGAIFNTTAVGAAQATLGVMGMIMGGCVRVGLEDNIYYAKGQLAASNSELVARIARIARELGKEPATPAEARQILGLKPLATD